MVWGWEWLALAIIALLVIPSGFKFNKWTERFERYPMKRGAVIARVMVELTIMIASFSAIYLLFGAFGLAILLFGHLIDLVLE